MGKKVAILQSNYIPWKGYFDLINMVDEFIVYDVVQFTKRDWRNRNKIKTRSGTQWLTIPVKHISFHQSIAETVVSGQEWRVKHWSTLRHNYAKARYFKKYSESLYELYQTEEIYLTKINLDFIRKINEILGIKTKISSCFDYDLVEGKSERLLSLCQQANASVYLSGPAAKDYLDVKLFEEENIMIQWMDYTGYKEYRQLYPPFVQDVTILDLIFNEGPDARKYMKSFK